MEFSQSAKKNSDLSFVIFLVMDLQNRAYAPFRGGTRFTCLLFTEDIIRFRSRPCHQFCTAYTAPSERMQFRGLVFLSCDFPRMKRIRTAPPCRQCPRFAFGGTWIFCKKFRDFYKKTDPRILRERYAGLLLSLYMSFTRLRAFQRFLQ